MGFHEEQIAKELLAGELEALREELGRRAEKRTFRDMTDQGLPDPAEAEPANEYGSEPPAVRPRVAAPNEIDVPDDVVEYSPDMEDLLPQQPPPPEPPLQPQGESFERVRTESEPEPLPTPRPLSDPRTIETVMRNERMDGNSRGYEAMRRLSRHNPSEPYFTQVTVEKDVRSWCYFEDGKWKREEDSWEFVNRNVIVRRHVLPRDHLCSPNKIKNTAMPRRFKFRQSYMVMEDGSVQKETSNWFKDRKKTHRTTQWTGFTVFSAKAVDSERFMVNKARGQGEVFAHEIKGEEWKEWRKTDLSEWNKVTETGAIKVLSLEESRKIRNSAEKERIIPSRMVRRWKPAEQPNEAPGRKSRWCLRGDKDPDLMDLNRHAPTLTTTSFGVLLQIAASMKYRATVGDLKSAFCQSWPLCRKQGRLYASLPKGGIEGLHEEQLVEIIAGVYGLGDAPRHWRQTLREVILSLGYRESVIDPTVYYLHSEGVFAGAIAAEVDDLFTFGGKLHEEKMQTLQQKFQFGKHEDVINAPNGVGFNGCRVCQFKNFEFEVDMQKFVRERLEPVQMSKGRKADAKQLANDSEVNQMRAVIGALNWLAKEGRPDAAAAASLGSSTFPKPTVQDLIDVNKAVKMLKEKADLTVKIRAIEPKKLAWGVISDASFGNAHQGHSQGAYAVIAFDEELKDGRKVPCSLISWRSGRIQKVVNSTLAAETQSLSKGLGELCWIVTLFNELMDSSFELAEWEERLGKNKVMAITKQSSSEELKGSLGSQGSL